VSSPPVGGVSGTATSCPTVDTPPTDAEALRIYDIVAPWQHDALEHTIGRYACGTTPLYRGTFSASDSYTNATLKDSQVIASLETTDDATLDFLTCTDTVMGVRALIIGQTAGDRTSIRFFQRLTGSATTYVSLVRTPGSTWSGTSAACAMCLPDLIGAAPATMTIGSGHYDGRLCDATSFSVTASGQLSKVATASLDDIMAINEIVGDYRWPGSKFALVGREQVATVDGLFVEPEVGAGCMATRNTAYHVDWYVNVDDPRQRGLRNFRVDSPQIECCHEQI
jgi:hypothetical protein